MPAIEFKISLRVFHRDLNPDEVTEVLSQNPTEAYRRGDQRGKRRKVTMRQGVWSVQLFNGKAKTLASSLLPVIPRLQSMNTGLIHLQKQGCTTDLFIGCFLDNTMYMDCLPSDMLQDLSGLGLDLTFDIYLSDPDSAEQDS